MAGFNEDTRVKIPALVHLTRLGYTYRSLHTMNLDKQTNIDVELFAEALRNFNKGITEQQIKTFIGDIAVKLNNEDLGREFYEKVLSNKLYKVIDYQKPEENSWTCVTELPCENGNENFRPDITLFINGLPLVFIEVKKPNNQGGIQVEFHRMNDTRLPNPKFRRFLNLTQLMIFSDNKKYDFTTPKPVQGAFYGCRAEKRMYFNLFREEDGMFIQDFPYLPIKEEVEKFILRDTNQQTLVCSPEYQTNKRYDSVTNSILTSLCSRQRLLYLLQFGFAYLDYVDQDTQKHIRDKHVMRYPQLFGTMAIRQRLDEGWRTGVIWHTQGSGKTALSYYAVRVLTDYYSKLHIVPKFYFFVDRLDLMEQATLEFSSRGLKVINVETRDELMDTFRQTTATEGTTGESEIIVVNIHKLKDQDGKIKVPEYAVKIQRIFFLDEAHRDYNPKGSFLARLFESDPNAIKVALTGTPLVGEEGRRTRDIFGDYYNTYYYKRSIEDGFTKRIWRVDIETEYRIQLQRIWEELVESIRLKKADVDRNKILEHPRYVGALLDYIVADFQQFRIQQGDNSLGGMIVCETNPQARMMLRLLKRGRGSDGSFVPAPTEVIPDTHLEEMEWNWTELKVELILHDFYDKEKRKGICYNFRKQQSPDLLIVNNMLLTGFDAPRLKRLYLGRKLQGHNLLQALTRVNRPYKEMPFGYIVDFADIQKNFDQANDAYAKELEQCSGTKEEENASTFMVTEEEVRKVMEQASEVLFEFDTSNAEVFASQIEDIDNREHLLQIRHKLEEAKAVWNEVRTFGNKRLRTLAENMRPGELVNLLRVVSARIENLNLKEAFSHEAEVSAIINEALATIDFRFRKRGENELEIETSVRDEMQTKKRNLAYEMNSCIDPEDEEYITLQEAIRGFFDKHGFAPHDLAEVKETLQFMEQAMQRIHEINRRNAALQAKYKGDEKFVRVHHQLRKYEREHKVTLISDKDFAMCIALNGVKATIDEKLELNHELIQNEPIFNDEVLRSVALALRKQEVNAKPADSRYIAGILANEYTKQYNSWRRAG